MLAYVRGKKDKEWMGSHILALSTLPVKPPFQYFATTDVQRGLHNESI